MIVFARLRRHVAAGLFAAPTFGRTMLHVGVIFHRFASHSALIASIRTSGANHVRQWPVPRNDLRTRRANGGTVIAKLQRFDVLRFAYGQQAQAVGGTRIASQLAVRAGLRTTHDHVGMLGMRIFGFFQLLRSLLSGGRIILGR
jgi:hypothetical protein